ncbi:MAG: iron permease FTR1 family protein [Flavobacteriales bacterium]|nr:iron permease FTR1 family protein [Flavobacteriales bacterium]
MNEFIITFRECLEATLIVGIVYTFLQKTKMNHQIKYLWSAVGSAIVASILVALLLNNITEKMASNAMAKLFEAVFMYITAGLLLYVVFWLSKSISNRQALEALASTASKSSKWGIFFLIFFAILREGFETVMFLTSTSMQTSTFSYSGFSLGIILACLIGYLIFSQGKKINLKPFFATTTFCLVLFAAGMNAYGTHEMESFLTKQEYIKKDIKRPWSILEPKSTLSETNNPALYKYNEKKEKYIHILHDKGDVGVFLKGFFGYNSNPNWIELFIWIGTLFFGFKIWRKYYITIDNSKN